MQMYFFIVIGLRWDTPLHNQSEQGHFSDLSDFLSDKNLSRDSELNRRFVFHPVSVRHGLTSEPAVARIDPSRQGGLLLACAFEAQIGE